MKTTDVYERYSARVAAGERLTREEIVELAGVDDILSVGMLADEARRRAHGTRVTYVRVACCAHDKPIAEAVSLAAREVRLTGAPSSIDVAVSAVRSARAVAGGRALSGFSLIDLKDVAESDHVPFKTALKRLRDEGLDMPGEIPVDRLEDPEAALDAVAAAGFPAVRLTMGKPAAAERVATLLRAVELSERFPIVRTVAPLPMALAAFRPTTGYEDVKGVALARLAVAPAVSIQVDWQRYGPKLAQVALTFGADDLDNVPSSDEAPDGRRRAPLEEVRRNIEAAGFSASERDGNLEVRRVRAGSGSS